MKVLYILEEYPALSETYIRTEIDFAMRHGVNVAVWARLAATPAYPVPADVSVRYGGSLADALAEFSPDVAHVHWLHVAATHLRSLKRARVPVTVRGHSFEFSPKRVKKLASSRAVQRIYLFPHFVPRAPANAKIRPMNACFPSQLYYPPDEPKDRRFVFRASSGRTNKDVASFITTAPYCPEFRFVLALTVAPDSEFLDEIVALNGKTKNGCVEIRLALQHEDVAALSRQSAIYFRSHSPSSHPFGMPASMVEAMAAGSWILARDEPDVRQLVGNAGGYYGGHPHQAAEQINGTLAWPEERWEMAEQLALAQAARLSDDVVLPPLLDDWRALAA